MVSISTCPSAAATGSTQPCRGWQGTAHLWRDKEERDTYYSILTNKKMLYDLAVTSQTLVFGESLIAKAEL